MEDKIKYGRGKNPNSHIHTEEQNRKTSESLRKTHKLKKWGFAKEGYITWNKGTNYRPGIPRHNYDEEFRNKIREKMKLRQESGYQPWNKGLNKNIDNRIQHVSQCMKQNNPMSKIENRKKVSATIQGVSLDEWEGFIARGDYGIEFISILKRKVKERDKCCYICKNIENKRMAIHHIDYNKKNNELNNLVYLCIHCHMKTNFNRWYWKLKFGDIMEDAKWEAAIQEVYRDIALLSV